MKTEDIVLMNDPKHDEHWVLHLLIDGCDQKEALIFQGVDLDRILTIAGHDKDAVFWFTGDTGIWMVPWNKVSLMRAQWSRK